MAKRGAEWEIKLADAHLRQYLDYYYNQISGVSLGYKSVLRNLNVPDQEIMERLNRINAESLAFIQKITADLRSDLDKQGGEEK